MLSVDFQMPNNDAFEDHEIIKINFVDNDGKIFASAKRHVIRFIDSENGEQAWFETYLGKPSRPVNGNGNKQD